MTTESCRYGFALFGGVHGKRTARVGWLLVIIGALAGALGLLTGAIGLVGGWLDGGVGGAVVAVIEEILFLIGAGILGIWLFAQPDKPPTSMVFSDDRKS